MTTVSYRVHGWEERMSLMNQLLATYSHQGPRYQPDWCAVQNCADPNWWTGALLNFSEGYTATQLHKVHVPDNKVLGKQLFDTQIVIFIDSSSEDYLL